MRVCVVALEFVGPLFSGNGTLARSFVSALVNRGHDVVVISGAGDSESQREAELTMSTDKDCGSSTGSLAIYSVVLSSWYRHDVHAPWQEFAALLRKEAICNIVTSSGSDVLVGVDWGSFEACEVLLSCFGANQPRYIWAPFQLFHCNRDDSSQINREIRDFYIEKEAKCHNRARGVILLSETDKGLLEYSSELQEAQKLKNPLPYYVLNPPLRSEMVLSTLPAPTERVFLTCVVRLLPAKNVESYVRVVELLASELQALGVVPYLGGTVIDTAYADGLRRRIRKAFPKAVIEEFSPPDVLKQVMRRSLINFHPAIYEAYGMTIVESACMETPTIMHHEGIGASDKLPGTSVTTLQRDPEVEPSAFLVNMSNAKETASDLLYLLRNPNLLRRVGERARQHALAWQEVHYGRRAEEILTEVVQQL